MTKKIIKMHQDIYISFFLSNFEFFEFRFLKLNLIFYIFIFYIALIMGKDIGRI